MGILDRYLLRSFVVAYLIWACAVLGFYVVVDAFGNLSDFADAASPAGIAFSYYCFHLPLIYHRLAPFVLLLAAIFTVTRLNRQSEIVPILSAGRSLARTLLPIFAASLAITGLAVAIQEVVIPRQRALGREVNEQLGEDPESPRPLVDATGSTLKLQSYDSEALTMAGIHFTRRQAGAIVEEVYAARGIYQALGDGADEARRGGHWLLHGGFALVIAEGGEPARRPSGELSLEAIPEAGYRLETDIAPRDIEFTLGDSTTASTWEIWDVAQRRPGLRHLSVQVHARLAYPLSGLVLLLVGLPLAARPDVRNVSSTVFLCLVVSAAYFFCDFFFQDLALHARVPEAVGGWSAPLLFAAIAIVGNVEPVRRRAGKPSV